MGPDADRSVLADRHGDGLEPAALRTHAGQLVHLRRADHRHLRRCHRGLQRQHVGRRERPRGRRVRAAVHRDLVERHRPRSARQPRGRRRRSRRGVAQRLGARSRHHRPEHGRDDRGRPAGGRRPRRRRRGRMSPRSTRRSRRFRDSPRRWRWRAARTRCAPSADNVGLGLTDTTLGCRTVVVGGNPFGNFESATAGPDTVSLSGWALDPDSAAPIDVHVYVDGRWTAMTTASTNRPDVGSAFPAYGAAHGFSTSAGGGGRHPQRVRLRHQHGERHGQHAARVPHRGGGRQPVRALRVGHPRRRRGDRRRVGARSRLVGPDQRARLRGRAVDRDDDGVDRPTRCRGLVPGLRPAARLQPDLRGRRPGSTPCACTPSTWARAPPTRPSAAASSEARVSEPRLSDAVCRAPFEPAFSSVQHCSRLWTGGAGGAGQNRRAFDHRGGRRAVAGADRHPRAPPDAAALRRAEPRRLPQRGRGLRRRQPAVVRSRRTAPRPGGAARSRRPCWSAATP